MRNFSQTFCLLNTKNIWTTVRLNYTYSSDLSKGIVWWECYHRTPTSEDFTRSTISIFPYSKCQHHMTAKSSIERKHLFLMFFYWILFFQAVYKSNWEVSKWLLKNKSPNDLNFYAEISGVSCHISSSNNQKINDGNMKKYAGKVFN